MDTEDTARNDDLNGSSSMRINNDSKHRRNRHQTNGISNDVLDHLLKGYSKPEDMTGSDGLLRQLIGALVTRAMDAELAHHLGYAHGEEPPDGQTNRRNGKGSKKLRTDHGPVEVVVPRDREGSYEPQLVPKHQRHFSGFDDKILSMYARGMSTRDIRAHLEEIYGVSVSPDLISTVTDAVVDELRAWQQRPLEPVYLVVYIDAMFVKIRDKGVVKNKAIYTVVGVPPDGTKEVLGLWVQGTEGAKFWLAILTELKVRGVEDILVLCADGLKGLPEAVEAAFPRTIFQTCLVHMVRSSTRFVPWKDRKAVCADLRTVYTAPSVEAAEDALTAFDAKWGQRFPMITKSWMERWDEITPFLAFPEEIRRGIYTTNAIEGLHRMMRKSLKTRGALPDDDAALKILFLTVRNAQKMSNKGTRTWGGRHRLWNQSLLQFAIHFEGRIHG